MLRPLGIAACWILCVATLEPACAGWGFPNPPSTTDCFLRSSAAVVGEVVRVEVTPSVRPVQDMTPSQLRATKRYRFDLRVRETLYGETTKPVLSIDWEIDDIRAGYDDAPSPGRRMVVFLQVPQPNAAYDFDAFYARDVHDNDPCFVDQTREIGRLFDVAAVEEQAQAVIAGCTSKNLRFRMWCMQTVAGKPEYDESPEAVRWNVIASYVGKEAAVEIVLRTCFNPTPTVETVILADELLADNPYYMHSSRRYELLLWTIDDALRAPSRRGREPGVSRLHLLHLDGVFRTLSTAFPKRADETIARMTRIFQSENMPKELRWKAVEVISTSMFDASEAARDATLALYESSLSDVRFDSMAAGVLRNYAIGLHSRSQPLPQKLSDILNKPANYRASVQEQLDDIRRELASLPRQDANP